MLPHDDKDYDDNDDDGDDADNRQQDEQDDDDDAALNAVSISKTADHKAPFSYCPRHVYPSPPLFLSLACSLFHSLLTVGELTNL